MVRATTGAGRPRAAGFSLLELLLVTAMIGIIMSIAIPHYL